MPHVQVVVLVCDVLELDYYEKQQIGDENSDPMPMVSVFNHVPRAPLQ